MNFALNTNLYSIKYPCLPLPKTISKKSNPMCKLHIGSLIHVILWSMLFSYILSIFISSVFSREPIRYQPPARRTTVHSQLSLVTRAICNCEHNIMNSLAVQWVLTAEGPGSTSGLGTKIPRTMQRHSTTQDDGENERSLTTPLGPLLISTSWHFMTSLERRFQLVSQFI